MFRMMMKSWRKKIQTSRCWTGRRSMLKSSPKRWVRSREWKETTQRCYLSTKINWLKLISMSSLRRKWSILPYRKETWLPRRRTSRSPRNPNNSRRKNYFLRETRPSSQLELQQKRTIASNRMTALLLNLLLTLLLTILQAKEPGDASLATGRR